MTARIAAIPLVLALSACATTGYDDARTAAKLDLYRAHATERVGSIPFSGRVDQWTGLGDSALAVWTSPGRAWLLELTSRCPDLDHAYGITFDSRDGRIDAGFDSVVPVSSAPQIPCRIGSIHRVDVQALRAAERAAQDSGM